MNNLYNNLFYINNKPISKQSNLKYLGIIIDDKLNWKPQMKNLLHRLLNHVIWNFVQTETLRQHFSCHTCLFFSFLMLLKLLNT